MGHQSRIRTTRKAGEVIHRSKLFRGVATAEEIHARFGIRQPCGVHGCRNLPVIEIKSFMLLQEFTEEHPQWAALIAQTNPNGPFIPTVAMTFGQMVPLGTVTACKLHQRDAERAAAKGPSNVLIEINRGPGADKPMVQVPDLHGALARA